MIKNHWKLQRVDLDKRTIMPIAGNVMPERTTHSSVTFLHPFSLAGVDGVQPAGTYTIETVEETLDNLSFVAYRRVSTTILLPAVGIPTRQRQVVTIDPRDLEAAQKRDAETHD